MACCSSNDNVSEGNERRRLSQGVSGDKSMARRQSQERVLLLGTACSGKSTLRKAMQMVLGNGFNGIDYQQSIALIHSNMISAMKSLIEHSDLLARRRSSFRTTTKRSISPSKDFIRRVPYDAKVDAEVAHHLSVLWRDPGIRRTFEHRTLFHIPDEVDYFFDRIDEIRQPNFKPSIDDMLRIYVRTTGIVDEEISTNSNNQTLHVIDLGGQRNERLKWSRALRACRSIIFVVAASEYDQKLYEDDETNRIEEALKLFKSIASAKHLKHMNLALVFTKTDELDAKLQAGKSQLKDFFPAYDGAANDKNAAIAFLTNMFMSTLNDPSRVWTVSHTNLLESKSAAATIRSMDLDQMIVQRKQSRQRAPLQRSNH
jgi:energy-coupling factor transporter ATP-binding protein EcfA2